MVPQKCKKTMRRFSMLLIVLIGMISITSFGKQANDEQKPNLAVSVVYDIGQPILAIDSFQNPVIKQVHKTNTISIKEKTPHIATIHSDTATESGYCRQSVIGENKVLKQALKDANKTIRILNRKYKLLYYSINQTASATPQLSYRSPRDAL